MFRRWSVWLALAIAVTLVPATLIKAALNQAEPPPTHASLAGQLLVASPSMTDPRFARTVILMVRHDHSGALGIVINRPLGERPIAQILEAFGETASGIDGALRVFLGGPVEPRRGFVIHSADYRRPDTVSIDARFAMTTSRDVLRDIAIGQGPKQHFMAFGYAGWGPGQLEGELKMDAWYLAPSDPKQVFEDDRDKVWDNAIARRPRDI